MKFKNFFIKEKEIVIDCFTHLSYAYDYAKIDSAMKYAPDWWRKTPSISPDVSPELVSIKHCTGLIEFYKKGITIPAWFELNLKVNPIGTNPEWQWESSNTDVTSPHNHIPDQFKGFAGAHGHNIKLVSPWAMKTKEDINFTWTEPLWSMQNTHRVMSILPGVVNYKYTHATEINLFVNQTNEEQNCVIEPFTPLVIMHPMSERPIKLVHHLVSLPEWNRVFGIDRFVFRRATNVFDSTQMYSSKKKLHEKIAQQEQSTKRCPFHRGN